MYSIFAPVGSFLTSIPEALLLERILYPSNNEIVAKLAEKCNNLRAIIRSLLMLRRGDIAVPMDMEKQILAEARAAVGEDGK